MIIILTRCKFVRIGLSSLLPLGPFPGGTRDAGSTSPLALNRVRELVNTLGSSLVTVRGNTFLKGNTRTVTMLLLVATTESKVGAAPLLRVGESTLRPRPFVPGLELVAAIGHQNGNTRDGAVHRAGLLSRCDTVPLSKITILGGTLRVSGPLMTLTPSRVSSYI